MLFAQEPSTEQIPPICWEEIQAIRKTPLNENDYYRPPDWYELRSYRLEKGQITFKKLFVIGDIEFRDAGFSPDYRYYYMTGDRTYLAEIGKPKFQKLSKVGEYYQCRFSPNSRYLVGKNLVDGSLRCFEVQREKQWSLTEDGVSIFGWYPDSRRVWYSVVKGKRPHFEVAYYVQDVITRQRRHLTQQEAQQIHTRWDLLNPYFRLASPLDQGNKVYAYSRDNRMRLKVAPFAFLRNGRDGWDDRPDLYLQWREGRSQCLLRSWEHPWGRIFPQDVSQEGRWALFVGARFVPVEPELERFYPQDEKRLDFELVLLETTSGERLYPLQGKWRVGPGIWPPLSPIYRFGTN
jgi:hypothetical protein